MKVKRVSLTELKERELLEKYVNHKFLRLPFDVEVKVDEILLAPNNGLIISANGVMYYTMAKDMVAEFDILEEIANLCKDNVFIFTFGEKQNKRIYYSYRMEESVWQ